jgi:hypothetical protein
MLMFEFLGGSKGLLLNLASSLTTTRTGASLTFTVTAYVGITAYSGASITFYKINSDTSITSIGTGTSNSSGVVTLAYTISGTDTPQKFYAYFAGNATLTDSTSNIVSINVEPSSNYNYFNATSGSGTWTVPTDVYSISVLAIGAGGASTPSGATSGQKGGGGGAIAWYNGYPVTPGQVFGYSISPSSSNKGGYTIIFDNITSNIIVKGEAGWQDTSEQFGDVNSANWIGQHGGRGGQGGTGYMTISGSTISYYWPLGGGGGGAGGIGNNPYYTGTGTNVGFNGPSLYVGPGGSNPQYTIVGYPSNQQPGGGSAPNWSSSLPNTSGSGGFGGGWTVNTTGVMAISYSANTTTYGWGAGGTGSSWQSNTTISPQVPGGKGFIQIIWGNNPASHTFPSG